MAKTIRGDCCLSGGARIVGCALRLPRLCAPGLGRFSDQSSRLTHEPWKLPLPEFVVECYRKSFGRSEPEHVRSLEEVVQAEERRRKEKQARKAEKMVIPAGSAQSAVPADGVASASRRQIRSRTLASARDTRTMRFTRTTYPVRSLATTTKPCSRPRRIRTILIALIF